HPAAAAHGRGEAATLSGFPRLSRLLRVTVAARADWHAVCFSQIACSGQRDQEGGTKAVCRRRRTAARAFGDASSSRDRPARQRSSPGPLASRLAKLRVSSETARPCRRSPPDPLRTAPNGGASAARDASSSRTESSHPTSLTIGYDETQRGSQAPV